MLRAPATSSGRLGFRARAFGQKWAVRFRPVVSPAILVPAPHSSLHRNPPPAPWPQRLLGWQTALVLVVSSWAGGGRLSWTPTAMLALVLAGIPLAVWALRTDEAKRWPSLWVFVPLSLWLLLLGGALLNPSYVRIATGAWAPRPEWIPWLPSTVDRSITLRAELPWLAALTQATLLVAVRPDRRVARFIWGAAAFNGFALAAVGAALHFSGADHVLGLWEPGERWYFFASFFYKNHWAAYGALGATAGTALALRAWPRARKGDPQARGELLFFGSMAVLTAITLPLPGSRAGALLGGFVILGFLGLILINLWRDHGLSRRTRLTGALLAGALVLAALAYGADAYAYRARVDWERTRRQLSNVRHGHIDEVRLLLSRDTWRMAKARPVFGWGVGSFGLIFHVYQGNYLRGPDGRPNAWVEFAHDDWLQLLAEAGVVGFCVLVIPAGLLVCRGWREGGVAGRWGLAGCGAIALFAWIDFPLNNPAVLMLGVVMLSSASELAGSGHRERFRPETDR